MHYRFRCRTFLSLLILAALALVSPLGLRAGDLDGLVLWDYRQAKDVSLPDYHQFVLGFCAEHTPERLILYVSSPELAKFAEFYDPTAAPATTEAGNYVRFLQDFAQQCPGTELEALIDRDSFPSPTDVYVVAELPSVWKGLPDALTWLNTLRENTAFASGFPVAGLTIDPELGDGGNAADSYQQILNYVDQQWSDDANRLRLGIAFGVDAQMLTKVNRSTFPLPATYAPPTSLKNALTAEGYPEWRPEDARPIADSVYLEAYEGGFTYWMLDGTKPQPPATAADYLSKALINLPYKPGTGTLTPSQATGEPVKLTGQGTPPLDQYEVGFALAITTGNGIYPDPEQGLAWKVTDKLPATENVVYATGALTESFPASPWIEGEIIMKWNFPPVTTDMVDGIWFIGSAEPAFMAPWGLDAFQAFRQQLLADQESPSAGRAVYKDASEQPIPLPDRFGLYSMKFICEQWGLAAYPGSDSPARIDATEIDDSGWYDSWFGTIYGESYPWVYHPSLGWIYLVPSSGISAWAYDVEQGWLFSSPDAFPFVYHQATEQWLYHDTEAAEQDIFYNTTP